MIRRARPDDAAAIAAVHVASWRAAYDGLIQQADLESLDVAERTAAWQTRLIPAAAHTWVAEENARVVGFCHIRPTEDDDDDPAEVAEVAMLYLVPDAWGRGHGAALLSEATESARSWATSVTLWVLEGNTRARAFYEKIGWRDDGGRKDCFGGISAPTARYRLPLGAETPTGGL